MKRIGIDVSVLATEQKTGIGVYCFNLIDSLLQLNHTDQFILFAISPPGASDENINYFKKYPNVQIKIIKLPVQLFRRMFLLWQKLEWPVIETFIGPVDIFHSFNWFFPPQKSGKSIATFYDLSSILFPQWHQKQTTQMDDLRFQRMAKMADLIITISENSKKDFLKEYTKGKIEVIYPASSMKAGGDKRDLKDCVLSVGTLEPRKNIVNLINGFLKSKINTKLVLLGGNGWANQEIFDLIARNKDKIIATGFVSDNELGTFYKNALCVVYPSLYEGFGIPVLEAMQMGVPVITSNTSSLSEVGGKAVLYIDPENIEELAKAMQKISQDKKLRASLIKKGFAQSKKFSWEESAKQLNEFYQNL